MWSRRRFLMKGLALLGTAGTALGLPNETKESLPDGSAAKGMVTATAEQAIDKGLEYLRKGQSSNGSYGTGGYRGNVALASLAGLAFMAGGHQPGRGAYGRVVTDALRYVLSTEDKNIAGFLHSPSTARDGPMYGHGFGTLLLGEVCGMVPDAALRDQVRDTLKRAVQLILNSQ